MISAILLYNQRGEILISRLYRDGLKPSAADAFRIQVISNPDMRTPVLTLGSTSFLHVRHENIYVVAVTRSNVDGGLVFEFLYKLIALGTSYFNKFDEKAIKNNFTLVYELLDEILDFGFPQYTETDTLKQYITTESVKSADLISDKSAEIAMQATGSIAWRRPGIKYRKNEVFVDIVESIDLLLNATGSVMKSDVNGIVKLKALLSGMPECRLGLNDSVSIGGDSSIGGSSMFDRNNVAAIASSPGSGITTGAGGGAVNLEDCQFHQCVQLGAFDANRIISFVPPDGEFDLMKYRTSKNVQIPFKVIPQVAESGRLKVEYNITVKAEFDRKLYGTDVVIRIPTPLNTAETKTRASIGKVKHDPAENQLLWRISRFTGGNEATLHAEVDLFATSNPRPWSKPPISMDFSIPMFSSSGIIVRYLKIFEKSNYKTVKWVRYFAKAGSYEIRF